MPVAWLVVLGLSVVGVLFKAVTWDESAEEFRVRRGVVGGVALVVLTLLPMLVWVDPMGIASGATIGMA